MQTCQPNLEGAGEIPLLRLVKEALWMRPSRILVGEVRQEECLDLSVALHSRSAVARSCLGRVPVLAGDVAKCGRCPGPVRQCRGNGVTGCTATVGAG
jgi:hypothetical protein